MSHCFPFVHSFYSTKGGPHSPEEWCKQAAGLGYKTITITDRAPLASLPALIKAARESDISVLAGMEIDVQDDGCVPHTVALFPTGRKGLANLAAIASAAFKDWPAQEYPLSLQLLIEHSEEVAVVLLPTEESSPDFARALAPGFDGRAFLGLAHSGRDEDTLACEKAAAVAAEAGLPLLAMPRAHYLHPEHETAYRALQEARRQAGWAIPSGAVGGHLAPSEEAQALFTPWPGALENAEALAAMCRGLLTGITFEAIPGNSDLAALKARIDSAIAGIGEEQDLKTRFSEEWERIERTGSALLWKALAAISEKATSEGIPLGATLGEAEGSPLAVALSLADSHSSGFRGSAQSFAGVEVPGDRREEVLAALAPDLTFAHTAVVMEITPQAALQACERILYVESAVEPANSWAALKELSEGRGSSAEAGQLALLLKGSPLRVKSDPSETVIFGRNSSLPTILTRGSIPWLAWSCAEACEMGLPVLSLPHSSALAVLNSALTLAHEHPEDGFDPSEVNLQQAPTLSESAQAMLKKGELSGVPYLSAKALKGWKGDFTLDNLAALVALSSYTKERPKAPEGVAAWTDHTDDAGGSLLYFDQFAAIAHDAAGVSPEDAIALRLAMLTPGTDPEGEHRASFMAGCLKLGLEADAAARLYSAMSSAAPGLLSRSLAYAHARLAMWTLRFKAGHPAAFIAAWLKQASQSGGAKAVSVVAEEARRLGVVLLPPDVARSKVNPTLERTEEGGSPAVRCGLAQLPGWTPEKAQGFVTARQSAGVESLAGVLNACKQAGLSVAQLSSLLASGACDSLARRESLLAALPMLVEWQSSEGQEFPQLPDAADPGPRTRYTMRAWEEDNLGTGFTGAAEMENLKRMLNAAGDLRSRLLTSAQVGPGLVGQSVCVVGLLCDIGLLDRPAESGRVGEENDKLAVGNIEDLDGSIELLAFPSNYKRYQELWVESNPVIVTARVAATNGTSGEAASIYLLCEQLAPFGGGEEEEIFTVKVRASRRADMVPLAAPEVSDSNGGSNKPSVPIPPAHSGKAETVEQADGSASTTTSTETPGYHLVITLPISDDDHADIDRMIALNRLLRSRPGPDTVTLRIPYSPESGAVTSAQLPRGVRYSPRLEDEVRELLGPDTLALIKLVG